MNEPEDRPRVRDDEPDREHAGLPAEGGIVDHARDVSERPQGDPEIPALGDRDPERGRLRTPEADESER